MPFGINVLQVYLLFYNNSEHSHGNFNLLPKAGCQLSASKINLASVLIVLISAAIPSLGKRLAFQSNSSCEGWSVVGKF